MRILIDLQSAQTGSSANRGIGRYSLALTKHILKLNNEHEYIILLNNRFSKSVPEVKHCLKGLIAESNIALIDFPPNVSFISDGDGSNQRIMSAVRDGFIDRIGPDHILICSLFEGYQEDAVVFANENFVNIPTSVILYDVIPLVYPEKYIADATSRRWYNQKYASLKRADLLLAISDASRRDAAFRLEIEDEKIVSISSAADETFVASASGASWIADLRTKFGITRKFVLYTGGHDFRKNIAGLIRAYGQLPSQVRRERQLVIVCAIDKNTIAYYLNQAKPHDLAEDEVVFTGFVSDEDLIGLYSTCSLFVFPSLYEGFGLPVLEAMRCGAPVICSNTSSMPEIVSNRECLFDPGDVSSIAAKMLEASIDEDFVERLRANSRRQAPKFDWNRVAEAAIKAIEDLQYREAQSEVQEMRPKHKKTIAIVSPLPPLQSGISIYSKDLGTSLALFYNVHFITCQQNVDESLLADAFQVHSVEKFRENYALYDRVIYQVGNSEFHDYMFELIKAFPGIVVLHDLFLSGARLWLNRSRPGEFERKLFYCHGLTALYFLAKHGHGPALWKYTVNKDVVEDALGVVVHSQYSKDALISSGAPDSAVRRIPLLRKPYPVERQEGRRQLRLSEGDFLIVSFGSIDPTKLNHQIARAFAAINANVGRISLHFVGPAPASEYVDQLRDIANNSPFEIIITGYVDQLLYRQYLAAADLAVQLRILSRGETSAAVLDCMAHGIPVIINEEGPLREYSSECVFKLPSMVEETAVSSAIADLLADVERRELLSENSRNYVTEFHGPRSVSAQYFSFIEECYSKRDLSDVFAMSRQVSTMIGSRQSRAELTATAIAAAALNFSASRRQKMLIDVSELARRDHDDDLASTIRNLALEFMRDPRIVDRVELVYMEKSSGHLSFRSANRLIENWLGLGSAGLLGGDSVIDVGKDDICLFLDYFPQGVRSGIESGFFSKLKNISSSIISIDFDGLNYVEKPVTDATLDQRLGWMRDIREISDLLIQISFAGIATQGNSAKKVAREVLAWPGPMCVDIVLENSLRSSYAGLLSQGGNDQLDSKQFSLAEAWSRNADKVASAIGFAARNFEVTD